MYATNSFTAVLPSRVLESASRLLRPDTGRVDLHDDQIHTRRGCGWRHPRRHPHKPETAWRRSDALSFCVARLHWLARSKGFSDVFFIREIGLSAGDAAHSPRQQFFLEFLDGRSIVWFFPLLPVHLEHGAAPDRLEHRRGTSAPSSNGETVDVFLVFFAERHQCTREFPRPLWRYVLGDSRGGTHTVHAHGQTTRGVGRDEFDAIVAWVEIIVSSCVVEGLGCDRAEAQRDTIKYEMDLLVGPAHVCGVPHREALDPAHVLGSGIPYR